MTNNANSYARSLSGLLSGALFTALGAVATTDTALADHPKWAKHSRPQRAAYEDSNFARVVEVQPIVRRVRFSTPQQECWNEEQPIVTPSRGNAGPTIAGGILGAALGHAVGHRHHYETAAVVGGALIGAGIGNSIGASRAKPEQVRYETVQRCQTNYREEVRDQVEGYWVTYEYNGRSYRTRLPYDPGPRLRVNVDVRPAYDDRYDN